jgi:hypothetical protein
MITLGLIGCGKWGVNILNTLNTINDIKTKVYRRDLSIETFIREVDAVVIAAHPSINLEYSSLCFQYGKPVFLEKPISLTYSEAVQIFEQSKQFKIPILVDNIHLFSPAFLRLRELICSWSEFSIHSIGGNQGPFRDYSALFDYGPHDLSMALSLMDNYDLEFKVIKHPDPNWKDNFYLVSESIEIIVGNQFDQKQRKFIVYKDGAQICYNDTIKNKLRYEDLYGDHNLDFDSILPLNNILKFFIKTVKSGYLDWRYSHNLNLAIMRILTSGLIII